MGALACATESSGCSVSRLRRSSRAAAASSSLASLSGGFDRRGGESRSEVSGGERGRGEKGETFRGALFASLDACAQGGGVSRQGRRGPQGCWARELRAGGGGRVCDGVETVRQLE